MGLFSRMRSGGATAPVAQAVSEHAVVSEHTVIAQYQLTAGPTGTATDIHSLFTLEERLIEAIGAARAGEFDGNEFGPGEVTLYAYGPDADRLYAAMEPVLRAFPPRPAHVLLRYGRADDSGAPEAVVQL
jgi:hypothetical protein